MADKPLKRLERTGRRALRAALRAALPASSRTGDPDPASIARVLVIRQDNRIGNLVLVTPLLDAIHAAWPAAAIDVLTSDAFPEVFSGNPSVRAVIAAPKKAFIGNPVSFVSFFRALRRTKYDVVFDASHMHEFSLSSAAAARLTGSPVRIGYRRGDADLYLTRLVELAPDGTHEMDIHVGLLRAVASTGTAGAAIPARGMLAPRWTVSADETLRAEKRWREDLGVAPGLAIGVFLGGRGAKKWPAERFERIAESIARGGRPVVFFGGPGEAADLERLRAKKGTIVAPAMPLRDFAATVRGCVAVVTADTGPMHVSVAAGVPTVEIFSNSEPERYGYAHLPDHRVVGRKGEDVAVEAVEAALASLLAAIDARPRPASKGPAA